MKIAMIGHKYVPSREGGVEIVVEELATRMAKSEEVTLFNRRRKEYDKIKEYNNCKIKSIFTINKKSLDAIIYSFFATLKGVFGKYDVLHFHAEGPCYFLWMTKFSKKKIVVTIHGLDWQRSKWGGFATDILKKGEKRAVKYADEIIVLSENNKKYFKEKYNRETVYIPNGTKMLEKKEPKLIKEKYGLEKDSYILFLARMVPEKGCHYLVDAYNRLNAEDKKNKKLVIAGGSSHSDQYYSQILDMGKDNKDIIFTGFVQGEELCELYTNASLYVLPSDIEGMPMSLIEAMSYGVKCLTSDIKENTEIANENCFSFKKGDVEDLKEKIKECLLKDKKDNIEFKVPSWDEVTSKTLQLYRKGAR